MIEALRRDFVAVADDDTFYQHVVRPTPESRRLEFQVVDRAFAELADGWDGIHQGHFVISPSGRMLAASSDALDAGRVVAVLSEGLARYRSMSRSERLLPRAPDPRSDRIERPMLERPEGLVDLRVVSRCLPFDGMNVREDTRHPDYVKLDRLWYRPDEIRGFLPASLAPGSRSRVGGVALERLLTHHVGTHVQGQCDWQPDELEEAELTSEVVRVQGNQVELRFAGRVRAAGRTQWNRRRFEGDLAGGATWDRAAGRFTRFEILAYGTHVLPEDDRHGNAGSRTAPLGVLVRLESGEEEGLPPSHWGERYRDWR